MNKSEYRIIGDFHTHTVASQHAYGTIKEMVDISRERGFSAVAITDHGPQMLDGAIEHHFLCLKGLPGEIDGVFLYKGAEVNMKTFDGKLDISDRILVNLDFTIASFHVEAITPGSVAEQTSALLHAAKNPYIDCLGHLGNPDFPFEHECVIKALKEYGKTMEINANSLVVRKGSHDNCIDLIRLCLKYGVPVMVTSDAHHPWAVGKVEGSLDMLIKENFPPEMILNADLERMQAYIARRKAEKLAFSKTSDN